MDGEVKIYIDPISVIEPTDLDAVIYNENDVELPDTTVIASVTLDEDTILEHEIENEIDPVNIVVGGTINTEAVIEIEPINNVFIEDNVEVDLSGTFEVISSGLDVNPEIIIVQDNNITDSVTIDSTNPIPDVFLEADIGLTGDVTLDLVSSNTIEFIPDEEALDLNETVDLITDNEIDLSTNVELPLNDELATDLENSIVLAEHDENEPNNVIIIEDLHLLNPLLKADIELTEDATEDLINSNTIDIISDMTIEEGLDLNESVVKDNEMDLSTIVPLTVDEKLTEDLENSIVLKDLVSNESINVVIGEDLQLTGPSTIVPLTLDEKLTEDLENSMVYEDLVSNESVNVVIGEDLQQTGPSIEDLQINLDHQNEIGHSASISMTENLILESEHDLNLKVEDKE